MNIESLNNNYKNKLPSINSIINDNYRNNINNPFYSRNELPSINSVINDNYKNNVINPYSSNVNNNFFEGLVSGLTEPIIGGTPNIINNLNKKNGDNTQNENKVLKLILSSMISSPNAVKNIFGK